MRGLILGLAVGLAVLLTAGEGRAAYNLGQKLNEYCGAEYGSLEWGVCAGYVMGVYDAGKVLDKATDKRQWSGGWTACVPKGVSAGQLMEVVKKWLREHPSEWHLGAGGLVAEAFDEAFPCR